MLENFYYIVQDDSKAESIVGTRMIIQQSLHLPFYLGEQVTIIGMHKILDRSLEYLRFSREVSDNE